MNFDRLTNVSKELFTVGEINNPYQFTIEIAINTAGFRRQFPQDKIITPFSTTKNSKETKLFKIAVEIRHSNSRFCNISKATSLMLSSQVSSR